MFEITLLLCTRKDLEFGTVLWNPNQLYLINKLQRNVLRFYAFKIEFIYQNT